jgi:hypothetical protein
MFHIYHSSCSTTIILLLSTKDLGGRGKTHNLFNASPSTASPKNKFHHQNSKSHNLFNASPSTTIANPKTANLYMLHNYYPSLSIKDLGDRGRSEEKGFHAVNSKQKSTKNSCLVGSFLTC